MLKPQVVLPNQSSRGNNRYARINENSNTNNNRLSNNNISNNNDDNDNEMKMIMITIIIIDMHHSTNYKFKCFLAHDELSTCRTNLFGLSCASLYSLLIRHCRPSRNATPLT